MVIASVIVMEEEEKKAVVVTMEVAAIQGVNMTVVITLNYTSYDLKCKQASFNVNPTQRSRSIPHGTM